MINCAFCSKNIYIYLSENGSCYFSGVYKYDTRPLGKTKTMRNFMSVQPCKIQQVLSLCFTIFYYTELKTKAN